MGNYLNIPTKKFVKKYLLKGWFDPDDFPKNLKIIEYIEENTFLNYDKKLDNLKMHFLIKRKYVKTFK